MKEFCLFYSLNFYDFHYMFLCFVAAWLQYFVHDFVEISWENGDDDKKETKKDLKTKDIFF